MARIVIVGDRDSGKTTFLTLVYTTQVKLGSDAADDFRFHVAIDSIDEVSGVFQQLMSGGFPDAAAKEGIHGIQFHLGYRTSGSRFFSRLRRQGWAGGSSASLDFLILRDLEEEVSRFRKGSSLTNVALRDVLESDGIAILVDSTKLSMTSDEQSPGPMEAYDVAVESLLAAMLRSRGPGGQSHLHPIFVFTKFDSVDPKALRAANVGDAPPEAEKAGPRSTYAETILDRHLPKTMALVRSRETSGRKFAKPSFFFSGVRTEPAAPGRRPKVLLRASKGGRWEPDYPAHEYLSLLETLSKIAASR